MIEILEKSYEWEVGFNNDQDDMGGITKDGITFDHFKRNAATVLDKPPLYRIFIALSKEDILKFYARIYIRVQCDKIKHPAVAAACFDFALNSKFGKREIQEVLRDEFKQKIAADNIFGIKTVTALNQVTTTEGAEKLVNAIFDKRHTYVNMLVEIKPRQEKFLPGWLNRIKDMRVFCKKLIKNGINSQTTQ